MDPQETAFARTLSLAVHEFRTPLAVAVGYQRMLANEQFGPLTDAQRKLVEELGRSCSRIAALVDEVSEVRKMDTKELSFTRQEIRFDELLRDVASRMHEGEDRGVRLEARVPDRPLILTGDRTRLATALEALMHAALRECGSAGVVVADCSLVERDGGTWAMVAIGTPAVLPVLVADRRARPQFNEWIEGMGFALPRARRVIEAHGGTVWSPEDAGPRTAASALRLPVRIG